MVQFAFSFFWGNILSLIALQPKQPTDLVRLSNLLRQQNAQRAALPASLTEPMLLAVARDLRSIENESEVEPPPSLAAPMMLVISLLFGSTEHGTPKEELTFGEDAMWSLLRVYQWAIEREIVTRVTGLGGVNDEETLLERLSHIVRH